MKWLAAAFVLLVSGSAGAQTVEYRLITQTYGGRIDIRKGLTQEQCEHDRLKALNQPADDEEKAIADRFASEDKSNDNCMTLGSVVRVCAPPIGFYRASADIRRAICEKQT